MSMVLGVGVDGFRRVIALADGSVRERSVADGLLDELKGRGLTMTPGLLVVTEGSRTLDNSLQQKWGSLAHLCHCRTQLTLDVIAHVPEARRDEVRADLEGAWSMPVESGLELLRDLENRLKKEAPGASERLSRSLEASLTVSRLAIASPLQERLLTAGSIGIKECSKFSPKNSGAKGLSLGVCPWLEQSRRLFGWKGLELLAHRLAAESRVPINKAAPTTIEAVEGAAERLGSKDGFAE